MTEYSFKVILGDVEEIDDAMIDALYEAGCDDGSPWSSQGVAAGDFDRQSTSLEQAIRSATADVHKAGYRVARVEIEPSDLEPATSGAAEEKG